MPKLGNKKYNYDKKGVKAYVEALKKKRKKNPSKVLDESEISVPSHGQSNTSGQGGMG